MKQMAIPAITLFTLVLLAPMCAQADWVILTSGEKFQTDRSWHEDGRLKFRLNGLVVSVPESDVAEVIAPNEAAPSAAVPKAAATDSAIAETSTSSGPTTTPLNRKQRLQSALKLPPPEAQLRPRQNASAKLNRPSPSASSLKNQKGEPTKGSQPGGRSQPAAAPSRGVFRNLAWGMRPSSIPGLILSQTDPAYGGVDEFYHPEEDLRLGKAPVTGIVYGFWQNRLYTITVWADGRPRYEKMRQWVLDTYGDGHKSKKSVERQIWYGNGSDRLLEFDEALNTGIFWMRSEKLHARIQQMQPQ